MSESKPEERNFVRGLERRPMSTWSDVEKAKYEALTGQLCLDCGEVDCICKCPECGETGVGNCVHIVPERKATGQ